MMSEQCSERLPLLNSAVLRRFVLALALAALAGLAVVAAIYRQDLGHQQATVRQQSHHILALQEELLQFEFRAVQSDLLYLATQSASKRLLAGDAEVRASVEREYSNFARNKAVYDQVRCLDTNGQEIVRVNYRRGSARIVPQTQLQSKATRYYYRQALSLDKGEVFVSPFDLNVEHGQIEQPIKPVIRFLTPIFDETGKRQGLLVLNYLGAHLLSSLKQVSSSFCGETMLVNDAGEFLQAPNARHAWGWMLGHNHSFRSKFPNAWQRSKHRVAGQFEEKAGLFTFQRVSARQPSRASPASSVTGIDSPDSSDLILISYVSSATATAHSRALLHRLSLVYGAAMVIVALLTFYWARSREVQKYHEHRIAESESRLRQLSSLLLAAQETERRSISRELHDKLGQQATAISLDLQSLEKSEGQNSSSPLLRRAIEEVEQLLKSVHDVAASVRPSVLDDLGLKDAVESFLGEYEDRQGIRVTSQLHFHRENIPAEIGENVFRILQESLGNVAAHAQVEEVDVTIETSDRELRMTVRDRGVGFRPEQPAGATRLGILGMRERAELLNGRFELHSTPQEGTQIDVSIPLGNN